MSVPRFFMVALSTVLGILYNLWRLITSSLQVTDLVIALGLFCLCAAYWRALKTFLQRDTFLLSEPPTKNNWEETGYIQL